MYEIQQQVVRYNGKDISRWGCSLKIFGVIQIPRLVHNIKIRQISSLYYSLHHYNCKRCYAYIPLTAALYHLVNSTCSLLIACVDAYRALYMLWMKWKQQVSQGLPWNCIVREFFGKLSFFFTIFPLCTHPSGLFFAWWQISGIIRQSVYL